MKITISPTDLEPLLAPFVGWDWRVDAIAYDGCLAVCAESKNLRIARRCPAQSDGVTAGQSTSLLVDSLYEIAQLGVKQRLWPITIDGRTVKLGHCTYELEFSRVNMRRDMLSPKQADSWFTPRGEHIANLSRRGFAPLYKRTTEDRQTVVRCGDSSFLLDAAESVAFARAASEGAEVRYYRGDTTIHSENCAVRLLTPLVAVDTG